MKNLKFFSKDLRDGLGLCDFIQSDKREKKTFVCICQKSAKTIDNLSKMV